MRWTVGLPSVVVLSALAVLMGCRRDPAKLTAASAKAAASATAHTAPTASAWPVPTGPALAILPGRGLGPIRFGATASTIERLMGLPCEVRTDELCGYNGRAVDFHLQQGVLTEIHLHRTLRKNAHLPGASYGTFNGKFLSGARLEMLKHAALELLGEGRGVEPVTEANPWNMVERHRYDDMTTEYDRTDSGNIVLGGVILRRATPAGVPSAAPSKGTPAKPK